MNFFEAISSGFAHYVNFKGRAARSEYWFWTLFVIILIIVLTLIDLAIAQPVWATEHDRPARAVAAWSVRDRPAAA